MTNIPVNTAYAALVVLAEFDSGYKMLLLKRAVENYWCHVAGKIENDETAWQTALRELREETSIDIKKLYSASYIDRFYDALQNKINLVPVFVAFIEHDSPIQLNHEHVAYKWCDLDEAKALVDFPNMKALYDFIWRHFVEQPCKVAAISLND